MKITRLIILLSFLPLLGFSQVQFVPNQGQWQGDFDYKTRLKYGALFFEEDGMRTHLFNAADLNAVYGDHDHQHGTEPDRKIHQHAYKQKWINAKKPVISGAKKETYFTNYFLGKNPDMWHGNVPVFSQLNYTGIYDGIDIHYSEVENQLKYNFVVAPFADPQQIKWMYEGADSVWISENRVIVKTSVGYISEYLPEVFTLKNGHKTAVKTNYILKGEELHFEFEKYNPADTLIIDPVVVFASFTGSLADNWGFTATYDDQGNLYGGGIVMDIGYPTTTGAYQSTHANPLTTMPYGVDCGITKFNATGDALLYSTYLGGTGQDQPHSMFVNSAGELYVFGITGSPDFPVSASAVQDSFYGGITFNVGAYSFQNGTDIFIAKFNAAGSNLLASTYIGGTGNDGVNSSISRNYSDEFRGEIVLDDNGNVYITASTHSTDFPVKNAAQNASAGLQEAIVTKLNGNLSNILWSTYFGGTNDDAGYGIKVSDNNTVYICGGTRSTNLSNTSNGVNPSFMGGPHDGYVAKFNETSGALESATYLGTGNYDQAFLLDLDKFNNVYVFGQTLGTYTVTPNVYFNNKGKQFLHKLTSDLSTTQFSTVLGKGGNTIDLVPTALNVDDCLNILLSGWGGNVNGGTKLGGNVQNMPISPDAFQKTTDGSDFYFMVLAANAVSLKFATYFGGTSSAEHVDGGTSRFDKHGNIYQAVCAGCGAHSDFPTTPGAWSNTNNSSNCNLGVVKINFETNVKAIAELDSISGLDTSCFALTVQLFNKSKNANSFFWDLGNGQFSTDNNPVATYDSLGTFIVKLVATDTLCDISDSTELTIINDQGSFPVASFDAQYTSCDAFKTVTLTNYSIRANSYLWDFGDGTIKKGVAPTHNYSALGTYTITLTAIDTNCVITDSYSKTVDFSNNTPAPIVSILPDPCYYGGIQVQYENDSAFYVYEWNFGGHIEKEKIPTYRYHKAGIQDFSLTIRDTICNTVYTYDFSEKIERIEDRVYIPNAFSPNRDNINEEFIISGNECLTNTLFEIYDSFGNIVFATTKPFEEFWDGFTGVNKPTQEDVYVYVFSCSDFEKRGLITVFY